jgi:hypothetical protein
MMAEEYWKRTYLKTDRKVLVWVDLAEPQDMGIVEGAITDLMRCSEEQAGEGGFLYSPLMKKRLLITSLT